MSRKESDPTSETSMPLALPSVTSTALAADDAGDLAPVWPRTQIPAHRAQTPFLQVLQQFILTAILVSILVAGIAIPAIWMFVTPEYRASAVVRVRPSIPMLIGNERVVPFYQGFVNTQVALIRSSDVIQNVLDRDDVKRTSWYTETPILGEGNSRMERLLEVSEVRPRPNSELIDVFVTTRTASDAAVIVGALSEEYLNYTAQLAKHTEGKVYNELQSDFRKWDSEVDRLERELTQLRSSIGHGTPIELLGRRTTQIDELLAQQRRMRRDIASLERRLQWATDRAASAATQPAGALESARDYAYDETWTTLEREWRQAQHRLELERARLGESNPSLQDLVSDVGFREKLLREREVQLDRMPRTVAGAGPHNTAGALPLSDDPKVLTDQLELLRGDLQQLTKDVDATQAEAENTSRFVDDIDRKQREFQKARDQYERTATAISLKEEARRVPGFIEIANTAFAPSKPFRDRRVIFAVMSVVGALLAGCGAAYVRGMIAPTVCEADGFERIGHSPFLGCLPNVRDPRDPAPHMRGLQYECIRMIRTALLERLGGQRGGTVLITSAGPRAGKTTVSSLLARSLAECGKRVLLVDADRHRSSIAEFFGIPHGPGVRRVVAGTAKDEDAIVVGPVDGLSILPAGEISDAISCDLFANGAFEACMRRWRERYDVIVIDSPPLLPVADARILARHAHGTILVMRATRCRRADVLEAFSALSVAGGRLIGTVLTGARRTQQYVDSYSRYYDSAAV